MPAGNCALRGFARPQRKWDAARNEPTPSKPAVPKLRCPKCGGSHTAIGCDAGGVQRFWRDYFARFPDYEGSAELNAMREKYRDGHQTFDPRAPYPADNR